MSDKGDNRAHRSHSTREAKQNKTNKKNQGSPIKTIKSHGSILVPLLGRGVFTAGFAPPRPIPYTYLQMCGGLNITKVSFGRTSSAGLLFFLVPGGHELFRSLSRRVLICTTYDNISLFLWYRWYFQHARFIPLVGVGKRREY